MENKEIEKNIVDFLRKNSGKRYTVRSLYHELKALEKFPYQYPTALKIIEILVAKKKVKMIDYGVVKMVWVEDG